MFYTKFGCHHHHHLPFTGSLIFSMFMAGMGKEREGGSMEGILDQCGLCYYVGMAIIEDEGWLGKYIMP